MIVYQDLKPKYHTQMQNHHSQYGHGQGHGQGQQVLLLAAAAADATESATAAGTPSGSGGSANGSGSTSTIQLSRKWVLPPKVKSSRKLSTTTITTATTATASNASNTSPSSPNSPSNKGLSPRDGSMDDSNQYFTSRSSNYAEKRRKQNREAQRAYRERKANKLHELQHTIDMWRDKCEAMQQDVNMWKSRYDSLALENKNSALAYESRLTWYVQENSKLKDTIRKLHDRTPTPATPGTSAPANGTPVETKPNQANTPSNMEIQFDSSGKPSCSICVDGSCICEELNGSDAADQASRAQTALHPQFLNLKYSFQDPLLQQTLDNWKPMKPVTIESSKKRLNESSRLPQFKRMKSESVPLNIDSDFPSFSVSSSNSSSTNNIAAVVVAGATTGAAGTSATNNSNIDENCGFCSESSTCLCREAQEEANRNACTQEPGSCTNCQNDATSKKFCENVVNLARSSSSSSSSAEEYIPINDAFQRIKKHMKSSSNFSPNNIKYDELAIKGRKVQLKSVMDIIQDMNKNFI